MAHMKTLTINGETFMVVSPTPVASVKVLASAWVGSSSPYTQVVALEGVTTNTKVDIQLSDEQIAIFHNKDLAFTTSNKNGVVTISAIGQKPTHDYTFQVTTSEVVNNTGGEVLGNTVGTPMLPPDMAQTDPTKADFVKNKELFVKTSDLDAAVNESMANAYADGKYNGKSAYQYAVDGGFAGTEEEFASAMAEDAGVVDGTVIFSNSVTIDPDAGLAVFEGYPRLVPDKWYTVIWNNKDYYCLCRRAGGSGDGYIGDYTGVDYAEGTDPFAVYYDNGSYVVLARENGEMVIAPGRNPTVPDVEVDDGKVVAWDTLYEAMVVFNSEDNYVPKSDMDLTTLVLGETYRVVWRGKAYDCVLQKTLFDGDYYIYYLGDVNIWRGGTSTTGYPFLLYNMTLNGAVVASMSQVYKDATLAEAVKFSIAKPLDTTSVKSVNGKAPDEDGNVAITVPAWTTLRTLQLSSSNCTVSGTSLLFNGNIPSQVSALLNQLRYSIGALWVSIANANNSLVIQGAGSYKYASGSGSLGLVTTDGATSTAISINNSSCKCGDSTLPNAISSGQIVNITVYQMK